MLVLLPMTSTLVKYRGWYSDFNRPFKISSAYFRCFLSGLNRRHFQQPHSLGEGGKMCRMMSWQVKCMWRFPHMWTILCFYYGSLIQALTCGNKMPTRCNRGFYCRSYCLLNMFRAPLCPSSGAQEYYTVVAACGISCCDFQVVGLVWSWGLCVRFAGCCSSHCIILLSSWWWA